MDGSRKISGLGISVGGESGIGNGGEDSRRRGRGVFTV